MTYNFGPDLRRIAAFLAGLLLVMAVLFLVSAPPVSTIPATYTPTFLPPGSPAAVATLVKTPTSVPAYRTTDIPTPTATPALSSRKAGAAYDTHGGRLSTLQPFQTPYPTLICVQYCTPGEPFSEKDK